MGIREEKDLELKRYNRFFIHNVSYLKDDFVNLIANIQNYLLID